MHVVKARKGDRCSKPSCGLHHSLRGQRIGKCEGCSYIICRPCAVGPGGGVASAFRRAAATEAPPAGRPTRLAAGAADPDRTDPRGAEGVEGATRREDFTFLPAAKYVGRLVRVHSLVFAKEFNGRAGTVSRGEGPDRLVIRFEAGDEKAIRRKNLSAAA